jgi:hypothetical protein
MSKTRIQSRAALLVGVLFCLLVPSSAVATGVSASVTVRVEGLTETKVSPTILTTTAAPIVKDGNPAHSCPGTSAAGALELATKGAWSGKWFSGLGYSVETIENESYPFTQPYFWTFWLNHKSQEVGVCGVELGPGDEVLLFPECFSEKAGECPAVAPTPLAIEAPATANAGEAVTVAVKQYNSKGEASPAVGANIIGGGAGASTDSQGHATLKFFGAGTYTLRVSGAPTGPPAVRTEATICVHEGNDGTCGTTVPVAPKGIPKGAPEIVPVVPANVAMVGGVKNERHYPRRDGPRILKGLVQVPAGGTLRDVRISIQRRHGRKCMVFSGVRAAFVHARCGVARFFSIGSAESFSYLLPTSLPAGRYVYDIEAVDATGRLTRLVPGVSHVVFYVK